MKLRIRGNSIRLRLTRTEVDAFAADGRVEELVDFGAGKLMFRYALETGDQAELASAFDGSTIIVSVPRPIAKSWASSEQVGIEGQPASGPRILIEKDFACLHERPGESNDDAFPNLEPENCKTA